MLRRLVGVIAVAGAAWLGPPTPTASACSCLPPPPPVVARDRSDVVFQGRPFALTTAGQNSEYAFEVDRVWKGDVGPQVTVRTPTSSAACGRSFQIGQSYVIYARRSTTDVLFDGACSRTRTTAAAGEDLEQLGAGEAVSTSRPRRPDDGGDGEEDDDMPREPPRIEPPAPVVPPTAPNRRGCAVEMPHTGPGRLAALWLGLAVAIARRRRVGSRRADRSIREESRHDVDRSVRPPRPRKRAGSRLRPR